MGYFEASLARRRGQKAIGDPGNDFGGVLTSLFGGGFGASERSTEQLLAATTRNAWAHLASTLKAIREAETAWHLLRPGPRSSSREYGIQKRRLETPVSSAKAVTDRRELVADLKNSGFVTEQQDHPFLEMMRQGTMGFDSPQMHLSGFEVSRLFSVTRESVGEWYYALDRMGTDVPRRWLPIPPHWVTPPMGGDRNYHVHRLGLTLPAQDVAAYRQADPPEPYKRGRGDLHSADQEVRIDELASQQISGTLQNHGVPYLLMVLSGLGVAESDALEKEWRSELTGPWKSGLTKFLRTPEDMTAKDAFMIKELQQTPVDLEVSTIRRHERDVILQAARVAPLAAGVHESGNRAMALVAEKLMDLNAIVPAREAARAWYDARFFQPVGGRPAEYEGGWIINWSAPETTDEGSRDRMMAQVPAHFSRADYLKVAGMQPQPGDEDIYVIGSNQVIYSGTTNEVIFEPPNPASSAPFGADFDVPLRALEQNLLSLADHIERMEQVPAP